MENAAKQPFQIIDKIKKEKHSEYPNKRYGFSDFSWKKPVFWVKGIGVAKGDSSFDVERSMFDVHFFSKFYEAVHPIYPGELWRGLVGILNSDS